MSLKEVSRAFFTDVDVSLSLVNPQSNRKALTLEGKINSPGKPLDFFKPRCCAGLLIGLLYGFSWMRGCKLKAPGC